MNQASTKHHDLPALDEMTGGAFTAPTSGERATLIRDWLARDPGPDQLQAVFKELSGRDKGAAKPVRERLDEIKRARGQEAAAAEWAHKAQALLGLPKLNLADALAWQRDAAKAGAPLSREPLAVLKSELADRVRSIEDLQNRVQVQREAAVLLAQRIEVLSTKPWRDAKAALDALRGDVAHWQAQAGELTADANWNSVDARFPPLLDASKNQLQVVWDAFEAAAGQAESAASDPAAPLPPVPVWADELRVARGVAPDGAPSKPQKPAVPPEVRAKAHESIRAAIAALEKELAEGHGKGSAGAAGALRNALKEHGKLAGDALEAQAHAALAKAGELEGWQRWRADQLREELVKKAEALLEPAPKLETAPKPEPAPQVEATPSAAPDTAATDPQSQHGLASTPAAPDAPDAPLLPAEPGAPGTSDSAEANVAPSARAESAEPTESTESTESTEHAESAESAESDGAGVAAAAVDPQPTAPTTTPAPAAPRKTRMGGRKLQETLRSLREQWKQVDQGGAPNHALWKRFDEACNEAHKLVEIWFDKVRADAAAHRAQRLALIDELNAWAADNRTAKDGDWKGFARILRQFGERWRESGHLNEKAFAELQPRWKEAMHNAAAPLEALQKESVQRRHAMVDEAAELGAQPQLRIDAVKSLQQRWQAEAQGVPIDRKHEQKLWDAFRKPIDDAFNRKTAEREKAASEMGERDRAVLDASKALEAANASGDAQAIRAAMAALDAALRGQAAEAAEAKAAEAARADASPKEVEKTSETEKNEANAPEAIVPQSFSATETVAKEMDSTVGSGSAASGSTADPAPVPEAAAAAVPEGATTGPVAEAAAADTNADDAELKADDAATPTADDSAADKPDAAPPAPAEPPKPVPKPVVAVRGDDRPGMKKADAAGPAGRGGKFGDRRDGRSGPPGAGRPAGGGRDSRDGRTADRGADRGGRFAGAQDQHDRGPRLGDAAFRAQREALEHAQHALKKLAAQAHGEALTELMTAWEQRDAEKIPGAQELGPRVAPVTRSSWVTAINETASQGKDKDAATALLRLEIAAEAPTPAEHISERRMLQLQLLTRRNDAGPAETWGADAATLLASPFDAAAARRLQNALKALLRR